MIIIWVEWCLSRVFGIHLQIHQKILAWVRPPPFLAMPGFSLLLLTHSLPYSLWCYTCLWRVIRSLGTLNKVACDKDVILTRCYLTPVHCLPSFPAQPSLSLYHKSIFTLLVPTLNCALSLRMPAPCAHVTARTPYCAEWQTNSCCLHLFSRFRPAKLF